MASISTMAAKKKNKNKNNSTITKEREVNLGQKTTAKKEA